jgi:hypothetical protein
MTTTEEVIRLMEEAGLGLNKTGWIEIHTQHLRKVFDLVRAEENEAIIAAANALENIASTSSSTRIRRVANDALTAIRARRK